MPPSPPKGSGKRKGKKGSQQQSNTFESLDKYLNQKVHVKFTGGREVTGILKGFDEPTNLVLEDVQEFLRDPKDPTKILSDKTRSFGGGMVVCRGKSVCSIGPVGVVVSEEEVNKLRE